MSYIYDLTDTWNAGGTVFTAIKMNVTNSASASGSKVISLQVNGTEQFSVDKDGKGYVAGNFGIGTSSPGAKLNVQQAVTGSVTSLLLSRTTGNVGDEQSIVWQQNDLSNLQAASIAAGVDSATSGSLRFKTASGSVNTERMRLDASGNLGIGTSSPGAKLDVLGASSDQIRVRTASTEYYRFGRNSSTGYMDFYGSQTGYTGYTFGGVDGERMRIDSSGNLLVGTTSNPSSLKFLASDGTVSTGFLPYTSGSVAYTGTWTNHAFGFATNSTERMRIDSSGNVGIGTATPTAGSKLHIYGASPRPIVEGSGNGNYATWKYISKSSAGAVVNFEQGVGIAADNAFELYDNQNAQLVSRYISGASGYWAWLTNGSERARIDASGNLLVGTTNSHTLGKSAFYETTTNYWPIATRGVNRGLAVDITASSGIAMYFTTSSGGNYAGEISINGTSTNYATSSDARLKHDIVDAPEASNLIDAIKVRSFKWNADNSEQRYGMVAQELLEVAPEAVSVPADEEAMMGVDYSKMVPMMLKEIQSLRARVAQLEGK